MIKILIRIFLVLVGLVVAFIVFVAVAFMIANQTKGTLVSSGENRKYLLYVPETYDPNVPTPLVVSIHGFAEWPAHQRDISRWNDLADQYGFIVVYPSGTSFPLRWRVDTEVESTAGAVRDVTFITDLIDTLSLEYNIDPSRIYANGLSNGGAMTFMLSCRLSDRFAAVGMVAGVYLYPREACEQSRAVPSIVFHGTEDPIVPYYGGPSRSPEVRFPEIEDWVDALAEHNGCASTPTELEPEGDVSGFQYADCEADVVFYSIAGGGHTWPGGEPLPEFITGITNYDIDATRLMWEFFQQHTLAQ